MTLLIIFQGVFIASLHSGSQSFCKIYFIGMFALHAVMYYDCSVFRLIF